MLSNYGMSIKQLWNNYEQIKILRIISKQKFAAICRNLKKIPSRMLIFLFLFENLHFADCF